MVHRGVALRRRCPYAICWSSVAAVLVAVCSTGVASAAPRMLKGPYLQDLASTSITVMWELDEVRPAKVTITPAPPECSTRPDRECGAGPSGARVQAVAAAKIAEARLEHLEPATRYRYQLAIGDRTWDGEFTTAPAVGKDVAFSFAVVGDSRNGVEQHRRVVDRIAHEDPNFILGTGDMVDEGFRQEQWQQFFEVENRLLRDNVFFPALGNHDRQGKGRTADSYRAYFSVPENGGDSERYYAFSYAASRFVVLDSNAYSFALTDQTAWIERELVATRQDPAIRHIFVVMHHPPFSISLHGGSTELRERWTPLFEAYGVTAVFSGHDHVYERAEHNGVRYFVTGGGGAPLYPRRPKPNAVDAEAVKKFERAFHFLRVGVNGETIEVAAIRSDGTMIETTTWTDGTAPVVPDDQVERRVATVGDTKPAAALVADSRRPGWVMWVGIGLLVMAVGTAGLVLRR